MSQNNIMALDVGARRIGIAMTNLAARLPSPLTTIDANGSLSAIRELVAKYEVETIIVGLPRGINGQVTEQTRTTEKFIDTLKKELGIPVYEQDETLTSKLAEKELRSSGKTFNKASIDALAATYILDDYLRQYGLQAVNND